jgi:serine/threonine protein phosphatase PrpC
LWEPIIGFVMKQVSIHISGKNCLFIPSGSTCVTLIYTPEKLLCANAGDSRAVLGRCVNGGIKTNKTAWVSHDLSRDHKPSEKDEAERIIKRRGRIEPFRGI